MVNATELRLYKSTLFSFSRFLLVICSIAYLSGCSAIMTRATAHKIMHPSSFDMGSDGQDIAFKFGFSEKAYCSANNTNCGSCINYYYVKGAINTVETEVTKSAMSDKNSDDNVNDKNEASIALRYAFSIDNRPELTLTVNQSEKGRFKGTVMLLHGYGANKDSLLLSAMYYQTLGFDVIIPDLSGHGLSQRSFQFFIDDHFLLNQLFNSELLQRLSRQWSIASELANKNHVNFVLGFSMGSVVAHNMLATNNNIQGAIFLAPLTNFPEAAVNAARLYSEALVEYVGKANIRNGALLAMQNNKIEMLDIDLREMLSKTNKPSLIVTSKSDSVSPPNTFTLLKNSSIDNLVNEGRTHIEMMIQTDDTKAQVEAWLSALQ